MRKIIVSMRVTLDGFIAGPNGSSAVQATIWSRLARACETGGQNQRANRVEDSARPGLFGVTSAQMVKECNSFVAVGEHFELIFGHTASSLYLLSVAEDNHQCRCITVEYSRVAKKIQ